MSTSTEIQTRQKNDLKTILNGENMRAQFAAALPRHLTPDRFIRVATTALTRVPMLAECTPESFFKCLLELSAFGLEPDGRRAHLIPFKNNKAKTVECQLIVDYKGLAELVMRSGMIAKLHSDVVCENDVFEWNRGVVERHFIDFRGERGEPFAAYSFAETTTGAIFCEVMSKEEIYAIRDKAQGWVAFQKGYTKQCPWDPGNRAIELEMWKKTAFRRLAKWLPLSAEVRDANEYDDVPIDVSSITISEPKPAKTFLEELPPEEPATEEEGAGEVPVRSDEESTEDPDDVIPDAEYEDPEFLG